MSYSDSKRVGGENYSNSAKGTDDNDLSAESKFTREGRQERMSKERNANPNTNTNVNDGYATLKKGIIYFIYLIFFLNI